MTFIGLVLVLIILGVVVYVLNSVLPMDARFKLIVNAVIIIAVLLWLASEFGVLPRGSYGRLR